MTLRRRAQRFAAVVFAALALAFFAYALVDAWHQTHGTFPSGARVAVSAVLVCVSLLVAAYAWATLLGPDRRIDNGASLLVSQLAKYVPGGVWQAAGQVGLARSTGVRMGRGVVAFTVMALTQAVAGCTLVILLAFTWQSQPIVLRVLLGIAGVATVALLDRRWMVFVLHKIPRTRDASPDLVPAQRAILTAWMASVVTITISGSTYWLLLGSFSRARDPLQILGAYAAAWTIGFIAVPIPSGVGIREGVLAALLHGMFPASVIVAASVYQRLVSVASEGAMAAIAAHRLRPARREAARVVTAIDDA